MFATFLEPPTELVPADPSRAALARIEPELAELDDLELVPINLDIGRACDAALSALPEILALRSEVVEQLPRFPLGAIDRLRDYTLALAYAHRCVARRAACDHARALYKRASNIRNALLHEAVSLVERGHVPTAALEGIARGSSYADVASGAKALAGVLRARWPAIAGRTSVDLVACERAELAGRELAEVAGRIGSRPSGMTAAEALRCRARCFTLFVRAYDRCRQAATFLRWAEGDADQVVPSLYRKRGR